MTVQPLSDDLVALVHHVELSNAGWRDQAMGLLATNILNSRNGPCSRDEAAQLLNSQVAVTLGRAQIESVLDSLVDKGDAIETPDGRLKLSEQTLGQIQETKNSALNLEAKVRARFISIFGKDSEQSFGFEWNSLKKDLVEAWS